MNKLKQLQKQIKKEFREKFENDHYYLELVEFRRNGETEAIGDELEQFLSQKIAQAYQRGQEEVAEEICTLVDIIESHSDTNTLEEWKQYKAIRNAIRETYLSHKEEETK